METKVSDVVVPELFLPYMIQRTAELSEFVTSGIVDTDPQFSAALTQGGKLVDMPFWNDLSGEEEVMNDTGSMTPDNIGADKDVARRQIRQKAWGAHDLAGLLAGSDPMRAIADLVAGFRARRLQAQIIATLTGVFAATTMADSVLDIHKASGTPDSSNFLTGATFIDATQLMGDSKKKLVAVMMHSAVESALRKLDLIDFIPDSEGKSLITVFQGKRVIVDDGCPVETIDGKPVYTTYLFGLGALALGNNPTNPEVEGGHGTWQLEFGRDSLASSSHLINRWDMILHPRGVKWTEDTVAAKFPTNDELENGDNWERVYERKNVRMVKIRHNIPA